ncbi:dipeptidyl peptidase IV N-terminal region-domain-containing protein [Scheffersomyces coipomensis]|uniref:dipeptidyl peptidase IV N-terminal region-domain-containing protein n=1 Tax=Scheffersomyces coipomensis TaxID=1788519 RepID=UPI00315CEA28
MFKGLFKSQAESQSTNEYEMVNQAENQSSSQSGSISTPSPNNGSEENVYSTNYDEEDEDNFNDSSRDSTDSQSSKIFNDIGTYAMKHDEEVDDFNNNPVFQAVLQKYNGTDILAKRIFAVFGSMVLLLWIIGIIVYSRHTVTQIIGDLKGHTNVQVSGQNITLNAYDPNFSNVTMDKYRNGNYYAYRTDVRWLNINQYPQSHPGGGYYLSRGPSSTFVIKQLDTDYSETVIDDNKFAYRNDFFEIEDFIINPGHSIEQLNNNYHMVTSDKVTQWRHSSFALYWLLNPMTGEFTPIQPPKNEKKLKDPNNILKEEVLDKLHFAQFSPKGDYIVYGFDHDLYLIDLNNNMETTQITNTGSPNIFNGKSDWVYEEEVFATDKLFWWSPDESHLIFASLNDTYVESYELDYYVKDRVEVGTQYKESDEHMYEGVNQYPIKTSIKYPKPGTANPIVSLYKYTISEKLSVKLTNNNKNVGEDFILYDAVWVDNENFLMKQTDRTSTILTKKLLQVHKSNEIIEVNSINVADAYNGWVEKQYPIAIINNGDGNENKYIDKVVVNGRTTLALFDSASSKEYSKVLVNNDNWDVLPASPVVYDKQENYVYFLSTIKSSMDAHLSAIDMANADYKLISITNHDEDGSYDVSFSEDGQYLNLYYKGPLQPWQRLVNMGKIHDILKDESVDSNIDAVIKSEPIINHFSVTSNHLNKVNLPTKIYKTIQIGKYDDNSPININVIEILPPNFNPERSGKYPILVHAYGGPGSQTVEKGFDIDFQHVVSATLDAIVLIVDPRGTGGQGWKFRAFAKDMIGYWEPRDITTFVSDYIKVNSHFVDKEKVALWGWSYGGFTTLKTLEFDAGSVFKYGMAVAPVTNWLFYDSIYTERYMNEPIDNENYQLYSRINNISSLQKLKRFLLMHGTADDNVHIQNSLWLLDKLNMNLVENYDVHFFPDSDHGIYYHNAQSVVYDKLLHWLKDAFSGKFVDFI